jgi:hypothetical protein
VVDDEQLGTGIRGESEGGESGIDGGGDARDWAGILDLETVDGAVPVLEGVNPEGAVAALDEALEWDMAHGPGSEADFGLWWNAGNRRKYPADFTGRALHSRDARL